MKIQWFAIALSWFAIADNVWSGDPAPTLDESFTAILALDKNADIGADQSRPMAAWKKIADVPAKNLPLVLAQGAAARRSCGPCGGVRGSAS